MVFKQLHNLDVAEEEFIPFGGMGEARVRLPQTCKQCQFLQPEGSLQMASAQRCCRFPKGICAPRRLCGHLLV
jgi:hypothetical protein